MTESLKIEKFVKEPDQHFGKLEKWHVKNHPKILHREEGPAYISYYHSGDVKKRKWYVGDDLHREDGPAMIIYNKDGSVRQKKWYVHGREIQGRSALVDLVNDNRTKKEILKNKDH
jgi:hypothetical protein